LLVSRDLTQTLADWLTAGGARIGEIALRRVPEGIELRHIEDAACGNLETHTRPEDARALANLDVAGVFRPLKTAPNLVRGWRLVLVDVAALRLALDYFYPAMLGVWHSHTRGELVPVPLRETLGRQTGMYRMTQKITDAQARTLIDGFCAGCLKCRLWDRQTPQAAEGEMPLLCQEACNLLVAKAREAVKGK
jgi:sirohydrochlorin cobaltochelatase